MTLIVYLEFKTNGEMKGISIFSAKMCKAGLLLIIRVFSKLCNLFWLIESI